MGQIFDRISLIARAYMKAIRDTAKRRSSSLKTEDEEATEMGDDRGEKWAKNINDIKDKANEEFERLKAEVKIFRNPALARGYSILGLKIGSDIETVTKKWKELLRANHPDKFTDPIKKKLAEETTKKINEAYTVIEKFLEEKKK